MPNLTTNYQLKKPIENSELADIDVINENMDKIDTQMKIIQSGITDLRTYNGSYVIPTFYDSVGKRPTTTGDLIAGPTTPDITCPGGRCYRINVQGYGQSDGGSGGYYGHVCYLERQVGAGAWLGLPQSTSNLAGGANQMPWHSCYRIATLSYFWMQEYMDVPPAGALRYRWRERSQGANNNLIDNIYITITDSGAYP